MDLLKNIKQRLLPKQPLETSSNQIDPEHFFEKMTFQNLYSDLMETVEVDMNELNDIETNLPISHTTAMNSLVSTNSSYVNSFASSFKNEFRPADAKNQEEFVKELLNEDEKTNKKKKKVLKLKGYMDNFFNKICPNGKVETEKL